jgi:predicted membrane protein (TIGR00267 family)|tara:strand:- start:6061 stop:6573 length:513 start_codon:yes stop_codon:yes gene_type:complete
MNGFDGALTTLGVIMGAYIAGALEIKLILSAGFGASLAMGISGATGAYMAEKAERVKSMKELEDAMFTTLNDTVIEKASNAAVYFVAFVDALSPIVASLISLSPFIASSFGLLNVTDALYLSLGLNGATLFVLGVFLGKTSRSNVLFYGGLMVLAGFVTAMVMVLISIFF